MVADSSGTHLQTIPQGPVATFPFLEDNTPRVSPDGSRVAYVTYRYSKDITKRHSDEIATANIDGSDHRRLTSDRYDYGEPAWSPDGSQIAFVSKGGDRAKEDGRYGIFVVDSDGGSDPRLIGPPIDPGLTYKYSWYVGSPVWSPNGEFIVFLESVYTDDLHGYIAAIRPDGSGYRRIQEIFSRGSNILVPVSFSPDGSRLVFALYEDNTAVIRTINYDGSDPRDVLSIPITHAMRGSPPSGAAVSPVHYLYDVAWSPDGSEIIFAGISESSDNPRSLVSGLHATGVDVTGLRTLLEFYGYDYQNGLWPVALSPDGSRLAVLRAPHNLVPSTTGGIRHPDDAWYPHRHDDEKGVILFTIAADGSDKRVLVREVDEVFTAERSTGTADADGGSGCSTGRAIEEPEKHQELVRDCEILLEIREVLAGSRGFLNWNPARSMEAWHGISIGGSPLRVESIDLGAGVEIYGALPPQLGELDSLKELHIDQPLTGPIPPSLGNLANLEALTIINSGGPSLELALSGAIPAELGNLTSLTLLVLAGDFTEDVPEELGKPERLKTLVILRSDLTGCIPAALTSKSDLYIQIDGLQPR